METAVDIRKLLLELFAEDAPGPAYKALCSFYYWRVLKAAETICDNGPMAQEISDVFFRRLWASRRDIMGYEPDRFIQVIFSLAADEYFVPCQDLAAINRFKAISRKTRYYQSILQEITK